MKFQIAVLLLCAVYVSAYSDLEPHDDTEKLIPEELSQMAKRALPNRQYKDKIHASCCKYFKQHKGCHKAYIRAVCAYTCGCFNHLSKVSCTILKKKAKKCSDPLVRVYCRNTCKYCPWLPDNIWGGRQ